LGVPRTGLGMPGTGPGVPGAGPGVFGLHALLRYPTVREHPCQSIAEILKKN
jgi:hypothetical protein